MIASRNYEAVQLNRRHLLMSLPVLACGLIVPPVQASSDIYRSARRLMGTQVDLTLQGADMPSLASAAEAAFAEMSRLERMMSRYCTTSVLSAINLAAGLQAVSVPSEMLRVLKMARQISLSSHGAFDATVGALSSWDFDASRPALPTAAQLASQLSLVNVSGLVINERLSTAYLVKRGMRLDLGGIAKLPILQAGMQQLQQHGVVNAMINGGGDVLVNGRIKGRAWRVGLRDPRQPDQLLGSVALTQGFIASSGDYERFFMYQGKRLHHILDPKTGYPSMGPHGVSLISTKLENINGLGAAIMVAGSDIGRAKINELPGVDALICDADNKIWLSEGMSKRMAGT